MAIAAEQRAFAWMGTTAGKRARRIRRCIRKSLRQALSLFMAFTMCYGAWQLLNLMFPAAGSLGLALRIRKRPGACPGGGQDCLGAPTDSLSRSKGHGTLWGENNITLAQVLQLPLPEGHRELARAFARDGLPLRPVTCILRVAALGGVARGKGMPPGSAQSPPGAAPASPPLSSDGLLLPMRRTMLSFGPRDWLLGRHFQRLHEWTASEGLIRFAEFVGGIVSKSLQPPWQSLKGSTGGRPAGLSSMVSSPVSGAVWKDLRPPPASVGPPPSVGDKPLKDWLMHQHWMPKLLSSATMHRIVTELQRPRIERAVVDTRWPQIQHELLDMLRNRLLLRTPLLHDWQRLRLLDAAGNASFLGPWLGAGGEQHNPLYAAAFHRDVRLLTDLLAAVLGGSKEKSTPFERRPALSDLGVARGRKDAAMSYKPSAGADARGPMRRVMAAYGEQPAQHLGWPLGVGGDGSGAGVEPSSSMHNRSDMGMHSGRDEDLWEEDDVGDEGEGVWAALSTIHEHQDQGRGEGAEDDDSWQLGNRSHQQAIITRGPLAGVRYGTEVTGDAEDRTWDGHLGMHAGARSVLARPNADTATQNEATGGDQSKTSAATGSAAGGAGASSVGSSPSAASSGVVEKKASGPQQPVHSQSQRDNPYSHEDDFYETENELPPIVTVAASLEPPVTPPPGAGGGLVWVEHIMSDELFQGVGFQWPRPHTGGGLAHARAWQRVLDSDMLAFPALWWGQGALPEGCRLRVKEPVGQQFSVLGSLIATCAEFADRPNELPPIRAFPVKPPELMHHVHDFVLHEGVVHASVTRLLASGPKNILPKESIVGRIRWERCAVVGNSGSLLLTRFGRDIDSHDVVFRINQAPTLGYEELVGVRTTFRLLNRMWTLGYGGSHKVSRKYRTGLPLEPGVHLVASRGEIGNFVALYKKMAAAPERNVTVLAMNSKVGGSRIEGGL
eukprot:jgi/Mesvir1/6798/Mv08999-RA.2